MSLTLGTTLLCVALSTANKCDVCSVSIPKQTASTSVQLTAQRNDTGFWTTQFGEHQMLIEHWHNDTITYDLDGEDSTWTIKVKYSSTTYQDITCNDCYNGDNFGQIMSTINKLTEKMSMQDVVGNKMDNGAHRTEDLPFTAGSQVDVAIILPSRDISEDKEQNNEDPLCKVIDRKRNETPGETDNKMEDKNKIPEEGKERSIMYRFKKKGSVVHDTTQHKNHRKGYRFYNEAGWFKLNTSDWQWKEARDACAEDGGHLAVPDTTPKIKAMREILKENANILKRTVLKNQVFVGLFYPEGSRKLTTVLGTSFHAVCDSIWFPHEPNISPPGENCVTLHLNGKMRVVPCFYSLPFICELK